MSDEQYRDDKNLMARIRLHRDYSLNKYGWNRWIFDHYKFRQGDRVLELGCGNGAVWQTESERIPDNISAVLTDLSEGMAEKAKSSLGKYENFEFMSMNAMDISFPDESFDKVIANHMLYHVPDIDKALCEICRVLKPGGKLISSTIAEKNMSEISELMSDCGVNVGGSAIKSFTLENGAAQLGKFFPKVSSDVYEDGLAVSSGQALEDYILSMKGIYEISEDSEAQIKKKISDFFNKNAVFTVTKSAGVFISEK